MQLASGAPLSRIGQLERIASLLRGKAAWAAALLLAAALAAPLGMAAAHWAINVRHARGAADIHALNLLRSKLQGKRAAAPLPPSVSGAVVEDPVQGGSYARRSRTVRVRIAWTWQPLFPRVFGGPRTINMAATASALPLEADPRRLVLIVE